MTGADWLRDVRAAAVQRGTRMVVLPPCHAEPVEIDSRPDTSEGRTIAEQLRLPPRWPMADDDSVLGDEVMIRTFDLTTQPLRVDPVPLRARFWRTITFAEWRARRRRRKPPRCRNCGYLITPWADSVTGWTHSPHWPGVRCPGDVTGAELEPR
jgi:hypothetical protein